MTAGERDHDPVPLGHPRATRRTGGRRVSCSGPTPDADPDAAERCSGLPGGAGSRRGVGRGRRAPHLRRPHRSGRGPRIIAARWPTRTGCPTSSGSPAPANWSAPRRSTRSVRDSDLRDRPHLDRPAVLADRGQHRVQAADDGPGLRRARRRAAGLAHRHPQHPFAGRHRAARRHPRRRAPPPPDPGRRQLARHRAVLRCSRGVAGRPGERTAHSARSAAGSRRRRRADRRRPASTGGSSGRSGIRSPLRRSSTSASWSITSRLPARQSRTGSSLIPAST